MHKGVILLVKASDKEEALSEVESFLELYGEGDVWDWYQMGGRWNNTLAPKDKLDLFREKCKGILTREEYGITQNEINSKQELLQKAWEECGLEGNNKYCDHYALPEVGNTYDIVPLKDCIETVKEWCKNLEEEKEQLWNKLLKAKEEAKEGQWDSTGYLAGQYKDAQYGNFCFDSNVYDITTQQAETIPENIEEYFAVMVDMHN